MNQTIGRRLMRRPAGLVALAFGLAIAAQPPAVGRTTPASREPRRWDSGSGLFRYPARKTQWRQ